MPEGSAGPFSQAYQEQPLSTAFRQAWQEWLEAWGALDRDAQDVPRMVERALELSTRITRRLWRSAFASVGDAAGVQVKAMVYAFVALVDETLVFSAWSPKCSCTCSAAAAMAGAVLRPTGSSSRSWARPLRLTAR